MRNILVIIGTRPEVIKLAPVVHALKKRKNIFDTRVCLTGQHSTMLYETIDHFDVKVDFDLKIMRENQTLPELTSRLINALGRVLGDFRTNMIIVQGDTTSAFVGSLMGYYNGLKVAHVEAGLRTDDKFAPFPEEMNRRLIGALADYHFAPTRRAQNALRREGVAEHQIQVTGNTVIDALTFTLKKIQNTPPSLGSLDSVLASKRRIVLVTGHRRENFGTGLENICKAIQILSQTFKDVAFIYPVHLNPQVHRPVHDILGGLCNVYLVPPMGYVPFVRLLNAAYIVLTDSGGIQEEAPSLGKPILVMRDVTERPEIIESGNGILVGTDRSRIIAETTRLLDDNDAWSAMSRISNPYGDGLAAHRIVRYIASLK